MTAKKKSRRNKTKNDHYYRAKYPWDQREDEGSKQYNAFYMYLEGDGDPFLPERSIIGVGRALSVHEDTIYEWSSKFDWVKRATAKDRHDTEIRRRSNERRIAQMNDRHAKSAMAAMSAAMSTIMQYVKTDDNPNPPKLEDKDAIRLMDIAIKNERLARGEPDAIQKTSSEVDVTVATIDERRAALRKAMENEEASEHLAQISKILGTDGGFSD